MGERETKCSNHSTPNRALLDTSETNSPARRASSVRGTCASCCPGTVCHRRQFPDGCKQSVEANNFSLVFWRQQINKQFHKFGCLSSDHLLQDSAFHNQHLKKKYTGFTRVPIEFWKNECRALPLSSWSTWLRSSWHCRWHRNTGAPPRPARKLEFFVGSSATKVTATNLHSNDTLFLSHFVGVTTECVTEKMQNRITACVQTIANEVQPSHQVSTVLFLFWVTFELGYVLVSPDSTCAARSSSCRANSMFSWRTTCAVW